MDAELRILFYEEFQKIFFHLRVSYIIKADTRFWNNFHRVSLAFIILIQVKRDFLHKH